MNRKILISGLSILSALGIMGAATFAYFSDVANSTGNTFSSGTLNLLVDDSNETTPAPAVTGSLTFDNAVPGDSVSGFISLHNGGSVPIAEVEMTADTSESADPGIDSFLGDVLNLTVMLDDETPDSACTGGTSETANIEAQVGNGSAPLTIAEFDNGVDIYDAFLTGTGIASGATRNICFTVTFDPAALDIYQGDSVSTDFAFTANQNSTQ